MSSVDIFYLALVLSVIGGYAVVLAYFSNQDRKFRIAREKAEEARKSAAKRLEPKAAERVLEAA
jgi:hypothetical protein